MEMLPEQWERPPWAGSWHCYETRGSDPSDENDKILLAGIKLDTKDKDDGAWTTARHMRPGTSAAELS